LAPSAVTVVGRRCEGLPVTVAQLAIAQLRGKNDITFGAWCEIIQPGHIHVGDLVIPP